MSTLDVGRESGMSSVIAWVCRNSLPLAELWLCGASGTPSSMVSSFETISSMKRLVWRALRETSVMPFLCMSSSSSVAIGT